MHIDKHTDKFWIKGIVAPTVARPVAMFHPKTTVFDIHIFHLILVLPNAHSVIVYRKESLIIIKIFQGFSRGFEYISGSFMDLCRAQNVRSQFIFETYDGIGISDGLRDIVPSNWTSVLKTSLGVL